MRADVPPTIRLQDYKVAPFKIESVELKFELAPNATRVISHIKLKRNPKSLEKNAPLVFDGEKLKLISVEVDGRKLSPHEYELGAANLTIANLPKGDFTLAIVTECDPQGNTALTGLYMSNGMYCTQCEAQGFRRITYF